MAPGRGPQIHWRADGQGPPLVLINGWTASGLAWPSGWLRGLCRRRRVIRPDNRGTGYSRFAETPFTIGDLADDIVDVLDDAEVERACVLGLSMGGMVAQELAIRAPDRVEGLVLVATRPPGPMRGPWLAPSIVWQLIRPTRGDDGLAAYFHGLWSASVAPGFADREPEILAELVAQSVDRPTPRSLMMHQMRAAVGWGRPARLAGIKAPTVILQGELDPLVHVEHARRMAALIPDSRYVELAGVGHLIPHEAPVELTKAIDEVAPVPVPAAAQAGN